ncbi:hypothetical protein [Paenibacillus koleovorans]|uniref:hypothetical protein n=1 Tax=Paenibacillus koleovorans TaxID=121608 RepID=UPI000FDAF097|nr:hypothetical protein [Paenibacillus koleovorans]
MHETKLIMIEGIPGSGKSTTAQMISRMLKRKGISHKWWYEEERGHPIYVYEDKESMLRIVDDLAGGRYRQVVELALLRWKQFVASVERSSDVVIVDSCLFGYLTWSLFPLDVVWPEITEYVREVERILKPLNPCVIYFYQTELEATLRNICERRGGGTESSFIRAATQCAYGLSRGLYGFDGMVTYWQDYRKLTDELFGSLACQKIAIDNSDGNWDQYAATIAEFLDIEQVAEVPWREEHPLEHLVGSYLAEGEGCPDCQICIEEGFLIADGLPYVWRKTVLLPVSQHVFDVQSLPFQVTFGDEGDGRLRLHLDGPALLDGMVDYRFTRLD